MAKGVEYERVPKGGAITNDAREWEGWGTALKPAWEPIVLARKPLAGTVAANVLQHNTGALNIDASRIETTESWEGRDLPNAKDGVTWGGTLNASSSSSHPLGRWPANIITDGSAEVIAAFPSSESQRSTVTSKPGAIYGNGAGLPSHTGEYGFNDGGSAARFFYSAKADEADRLGSKHPTVKPVDLMAYLCRLVTPPGGIVLDPFAGSGSTGMACMREGFDCILIEREANYIADIKRRLAHVKGEDTPLFSGEVA